MERYKPLEEIAGLDRYLTQGPEDSYAPSKEMEEFFAFLESHGLMTSQIVNQDEAGLGYKEFNLPKPQLFSESAEEVDHLINRLIDEDFYNRDQREEMVKCLHLLLRVKDPEQRKRVRKVFRSASDFFSTMDLPESLMSQVNRFMEANEGEQFQYIYEVLTHGKVTEMSVEGGGRPFDSSSMAETIQEAIDADYEDLAQYIDASDRAINGVVTKMETPQVVERGRVDKFTLRWVVHCNEKLTPLGEEDLANYISGQCSDGWGEGFEQHAIDTDESEEWVDDVTEDENGEEVDNSGYVKVQSEIYASPWYSQAPRPTVRLIQSPGVVKSSTQHEVQAVEQGLQQIVGRSHQDSWDIMQGDGNVFGVIGRVSKALKKYASSQIADQYKKKAFKLRSYDEVLQLSIQFLEQHVTNVT